MDQLTSMRIFLRVAELSSFTQAGDSMGLAKTSVSAAVQHLEKQLGSRLLHRTTRKVQLTPDGQAFYQRCQDLLADIDDMQTMFTASQAELSGRLRVDMSSGIARHIVLPRLPEFLRAHPRLDVEFSSTDRRVDLVREGFDCVLRVGKLSDSSLIARPLGFFPLLNCVSRDYLARYGTPDSLAALAGHHLVHYLPSLGGKSAGFEYVEAGSGETRFIAMQGAVTVNNAEAYQAACLAGIGIIQVPADAVRRHLASGELVEILPQYRAAPMPVSLLYANRRHLPQRVQVFMNWVSTVIQPHLES